MGQNKKLSLKKEVEKEARKIELEIKNNPNLSDMEVSDKMEKELLAEIQAYEKSRAGEHEHGTVGDMSEEFAEDYWSNFDACTNDKHVVQLSEEDLEALRLGRELLKKKSTEELFEVKKDYHKHLNSDRNGKEDRKNKGEKAKVLHMPRKRRLVIALVAVCALVLGMGMTSVGSKSYWKELINGILGNEVTETINVKDMEKKETEDGDEITAYRAIGEELGLLPVRFGYLPENMEFESSSIDLEQRRALLFYRYDGEIIRYGIYENDSDSSFTQKKEDILKNVFVVESAEQDIEVQEYSVEGYDTPRYIANFDYKGIHYQLKGAMKKEDIINIIENLIYFNKAT